MRTRSEEFSKATNRIFVEAELPRAQLALGGIALPYKIKTTLKHDYAVRRKLKDRISVPFLDTSVPIDSRNLCTCHFYNSKSQTPGYLIDKVYTNTSHCNDNEALVQQAVTSEGKRAKMRYK